MLGGVVVIQRIRVRWSTDARGASDADLRRGLTDARRLPESLPDGPVVVHDVLADHANGYRLTEQVISGRDPASSASLQLSETERGVTVQVCVRGAVYPLQDRQTRLFTLAPGEIGLYRANFRFRGQCCCSASWWYEDWTVRVANAPARPELFLHQVPQQVSDRRVGLYGGRARLSAA
ncbi:hypothetical protein GCM10009661_22010 [Catellatospora chokoriensis]|uniref:Uncharacterized protein n=1 Tax=Catellatospora chokoriensis TaxID=310353 RepID=A0A8J3NRF4_9ACTN|nr:hypothetical protein Cch02nite_27820 [Catellatospora chokoriensis]